MSVISISHITKSFGDVQVLKDFNEVFQDGEFITLLGPSGCGKTTMLRILAGFERPTSGELSIDGVVVNSDTVFIPPEKREIGMVFQSYAVWPHMTVFDNVAYPLKIKKVPKDVIKKKVMDILEVVHLSQYADRLPSQLSGGQQQRVALGRALVAEPKLLLLDEPLSNLDAKLRENMRYEIKDIQKKLGITVVYVTHDQIEAMTMSDRVFVINRGVVQQVGSPEDIYKRPANQFVADFVGKLNFLKGKVENGRIQLKGLSQSLPYTGPLTGDVMVCIRPENIHITPKEISVLSGTLSHIYYLGNENDCRVQLGENIFIRMSTYPDLHDLQLGQELFMELSDFLVYPDDGEAHTKILT